MDKEIEYRKSKNPFWITSIKGKYLETYSHLEEQIENVPSTIKARFGGLGLWEERHDPCVPVSRSMCPESA